MENRPIRYVYETDKDKSDEVWRQVADLFVRCARKEQKKEDDDQIGKEKMHQPS